MRCISAGSKMSPTNVDLPEPDTPVTHTNLPSGIVTSILRRLCSRAPLTVLDVPSPRRRTPGPGMCRLPERYCPVIEALHFNTPFPRPEYPPPPPCSPAPG